MRNLQIGVDKLVGKVSINLLHPTKSAACIINIIIIVPAVAYVHRLVINKFNKFTTTDLL